MSDLEEKLISIEAERRGVTVEVVKAEKEPAQMTEARRFGRQLLVFIALAFPLGIATPIFAWRYLPNWLAALVSSLL